MELNAEQTKKALECCASEEYICTQCPIDEKIKDDCECGKVVARNALALITSLELRIKELTYDNEELKNQLEEADITEEDIDLLDEYTRLLNEGIRDAKADTVRKMQERLAQSIGTYTDKSFVYVTAMFRLIDQIAKEMLEGEDET